MENHSLTIPRPAYRTWQQHFSLALLALATVLPHLFYLPFSVSAYYVGLSFLTLTLLKYSHKKSVNVLKLTLTLIGVALVTSNYNAASTGEIANAILCLVIVLKPLESHTSKSCRSFVLICYFCIIAFFFHTPNDAWLIYYAFCILFLTAYIKTIEWPALPFKAALKSASGLLLQTIPLVAILFFLFPRLSEPLWQWNPYKNNQQSGISSQIELGDLGKLSLSDEIVFKAQFKGTQPQKTDLYWRGPVFEFTDGRVWDSDYFNKQPMPQSQVVRLSDSVETGQVFRYEIKQEANYKKWLIALDMPIANSRQAFISEEYQLLSHRKNDSVQQYSMTSALNYKSPSEPEYIYRKALQLPARARMARQTQRLGQYLRSSMAGEKDIERKIIQQALLFFREKPFYYSLDVTSNPSNPIDDFMFNSQRGYCSHYASAMTMILRAAEIPARMVAGYRGGEWNSIGEYWVVKQKHAHAWVEAWIENYGWVRIDPTTVIPPERILENSLNNTENSIFNGNLSAQLISMPGFEQLVKNKTTSQENEQNTEFANKQSLSVQAYLDQIIESTVSTAIYIKDLGLFFWDAWVKGFDHQRQKSLIDLSLLGGVATLLGLIALFLASYILWVFLTPKLKRRTTKQQPVQQSYQMLTRALMKRGIQIPENMPHSAVLQLIIARQIFDPSLVRETFRTYENLRYAQQEQQVQKAEVKHFRLLIKQLLASESAS